MWKTSMRPKYCGFALNPNKTHVFSDHREFECKFTYVQNHIQSWKQKMQKKHYLDSDNPVDESLFNST